MDEEDHGLFNKEASRSHNRRMKCCLLTVVLLLAISVVLSTVVIGLGAAYGLKLWGNNCGDTCMTESCVQLAATVISNMNASVDPCADFYNFSCGGWVQQNIIPPGRGLWGVFDQLNTRNQIRLKKLIESDVDSDIEAIQIARQLYSACTNLDAITKKSARPLLDIINSTGGWSLIGQLAGNCRHLSLCVHCVCIVRGSSARPSPSSSPPPFRQVDVYLMFQFRCRMGQWRRHRRRTVNRTYYRKQASV